MIYKKSHKHNHIFTGQNRISDLFINAARRLEEYDYIINNIIKIHDIVNPSHIVRLLKLSKLNIVISKIRLV